MTTSQQLEDRMRDSLARARKLMNEHGLNDWRLALDKRPTRRLGQTRYSQRTIGITARLLAFNPWPVVEQVVLHEVAHALVGPGKAHGYEWQAQARAIGVKNPRRSTKAATALWEAEAMYQ
jgi:predicted SprT family Zn-dependent metalloprotease